MGLTIRGICPINSETEFVITEANHSHYSDVTHDIAWMQFKVEDSVGGFTDGIVVPVVLTPKGPASRIAFIDMLERHIAKYGIDAFSVAKDTVVLKGLMVATGFTNEQPERFIVRSPLGSRFSTLRYETAMSDEADTVMVGGHEMAFCRNLYIEDSKNVANAKPDVQQRAIDTFIQLLIKTI